MTLPPLTFLCITVLARSPDAIPPQHPPIPASPAILDALPAAPDPSLCATIALLVRPIPPHLRQLALPLAHPVLPVLQRIPDASDFSLVTLLALPNCTHLRDDNIADLRALHRLLALDLRGCSISSYALIALARGLAVPARTGTWRLRLLGLHGCPNIDDDALPALAKFPLLSAVDLRFTRCTPAAIDTHLSSLGFRSSDINSLFHPAPLSLALCSLEKIAVSASHPIPLYSCPPQSVFHLHINELDHLPSRSKKAALGSRPTLSSAEDTVVFIPPPRKPCKTELVPPSKPSVIVPASSPSTSSNLASNVASFYENVPRNRHSRKSILPLSAQAVQSSQGGKSDPLAIARLPPPWNILDSYASPAPFRQSSPDDIGSLRRKESIPRWTGQSLNKPLKVDRTRLHKRRSDAVADMVHRFASKRPKVESEFAKARADVSAKSRNPFARTTSMFAQSTASIPDTSRSSVHESLKETELGGQLRACQSLPCKSVRQQQTDIERTGKPLKPITSLKPPILPKELLSLPQPKPELRQTRLAFAQEG